MISQHKYIQDIRTKFVMSDCQPSPTLQAVSVVSEKETRMSVDQITKQPLDYSGVNRPLTYFARGTRPNIAYAVRELSKYLSCCTKTYLKVSESVLK